MIDLEFFDYCEKKTLKLNKAFVKNYFFKFEWTIFISNLKNINTCFFSLR